MENENLGFFDNLFPKSNSDKSSDTSFIGKVKSNAELIQKASQTLNQVGSIVSKVGGTVKNILGIGKNKEAADAAEKALAETRTQYNSFKVSMPEKIREMEQDLANVKQKQTEEIAQLERTLMSI